MIDFSTVTNIMLGNQQVTQIEDSLGNVLWSGEQEDNTEYFYIVNTYSSTNKVSIQKDKSDAPDITVYYSTNKSTWTLMGTTSTTAITYTIPKNGRVYLKANAPSGWAYMNQAGGAASNYISTRRTATIGGNPKSLIFGDNYRKLNNHIPDYAFLGLFSSAANITSAINLQLVEDILTPHCYAYMFSRCTSLTTAPALPATTLATQCYSGMFNNCTSLTTAPATLPATTLAENCCNNMFRVCTSLTTAPELPATTLAEGCYFNMFNGCSALQTAPQLPATTLVKNCYLGMLANCTALTQAPALPATTLVQGCYQQMFINSTSLIQITTYAQDISAKDCLNNWLSGVSQTGDFYNLGNPAPTYPSGTSGIPEGWTEHTSL